MVKRAAGGSLCEEMQHRYGKEAVLQQLQLRFGSTLCDAPAGCSSDRTTGSLQLLARTRRDNSEEYGHQNTPETPLTGSCGPRPSIGLSRQSFQLIACPWLHDSSPQHNRETAAHLRMSDSCASERIAHSVGHCPSAASAGGDF